MNIGDWLGQIIPFLISSLFNFVTTVLVTAVQVITWPINQLIISAFPDLAQQITSVSSNLSQLLTFFPYLFTLLPIAVSTLILFIMGVELTLLGVFRSTFFVTKLWRIVQALKFW